MLLSSDSGKYSFGLPITTPLRVVSLGGGGSGTGLLPIRIASVSGARAAAAGPARGPAGTGPPTWWFSVWPLRLFPGGGAHGNSSKVGLGAEEGAFGPRARPRRGLEGAHVIFEDLGSERRGSPSDAM